jgi:PhnB protein
MLVPGLYLKGKCEEGISQYVKAFGADIKVIIPYPEHAPKKGVMHSEIDIHGQRIMLNDYGWNYDYKKRGSMQLGVVFNSVEDLKKSYKMMKEGSRTLHPMEATDYSPCVVEFWDKFGVPWGFMVGKA